MLFRLYCESAETNRADAKASDSPHALIAKRSSRTGFRYFPIATTVMRKVEAQMIEAIRDLIGNADYDGVYFKSGNTTVGQTHHGIAHTIGYERIISVRLHGNEIAAIRPAEGTVWISDCGWRTNTTKSRLWAIMRGFTEFHYWLTQEKGQWIRRHPSGARYAWEGSDVFPLRQQWDDEWYGLPDGVSGPCVSVAR